MTRMPATVAVVVVLAGLLGWLGWTADGTPSSTAAGALEATSTPAPAATASARPEPTPEADVVARMPARLGGVATELSVLRGEEHVAALDPDDPADADVAAGITSLLEATGRSIVDLTTAYAVAGADDFVAFVIGIRVAGAPDGSLLPAYLPILRRDLVDPHEEPGMLGGREVLVVTSEATGGGPRLSLHVVEDGDTLWLLQGPLAVVEDALLDLGLARA